MLVDVDTPAYPAPSFNVEIYVHIDGLRLSDTFLQEVAGPDDITDGLQNRIDNVLNDALMRRFAMPEQECVGICILKHTLSDARFFMFFRFTPLRRADLMHTYMRELTDQIGAFLCGERSFNQRLSGVPH